MSADGELLGSQDVSLHLTSWPAARDEWRTGRKVISRMSTVLDQVRTLCTKLQLGNNARVSTLVLNAGDEQSRSSATTMAARLRAAARAEQIVFGAAEHEGGVPGIAIDIVA